MTEQTKAEAGAKLAEALALLDKTPPGPWRATPSFTLGDSFQNIDVMDGDDIAATVGYLSLPGASDFGPLIAAAVNLLRDHGEFLQAAAESHARALIGASEVRNG